MKPPAGMFTLDEEAVIAVWEKYRREVGELGHGYAGYHNGDCRCDICRKATAEHSRKRRALLRGATPRRHGRVGYTEYGCRCDICKSAAAEYKRTIRARRWGAEPPRHGAIGYQTYGCRCDICKSAAAARYQARKRVKALAS